MKKTSSMDVGAIGFHDESKVNKLRITKDNAIVKELNKTKEVILNNFSFSIISVLTQS